MANSLPLLYLDTSIPSAYYNDRDPERQIITQHVWHTKLAGYHLVISNMTFKELGATKNRKRMNYKESPTMRELHRIRQELEKQQEASGLSYAEWLRATEGDLKKTLAEVGF
jgi:hypothetical protein